MSPSSRIRGSEASRAMDAGPGPKGSVMTASFELQGQQFTALNGGPRFKFTEAISFVVSCDTQEEVDELSERLSEGGETQQCGWLKDKFGLSWQIVPTVLMELMSDPDPEKSRSVMDGEDGIPLLARGRDNSRCKLCGSPLFALVREGRFFHVRMGTLVDDPGIRPMFHIFVGSKAPWHEITDSLPQYAELPPAEG